jgi:hypothetical protein
VFVVLVLLDHLSDASDAFTFLFDGFGRGEARRRVVFVVFGFLLGIARRAVVFTVWTGHDVRRVHLSRAVGTGERLRFGRRTIGLGLGLPTLGTVWLAAVVDDILGIARFVALRTRERLGFGLVLGHALRTVLLTVLVDDILRFARSRAVWTRKRRGFRFRLALRAHRVVVIRRMERSLARGATR